MDLGRLPNMLLRSRPHPGVATLPLACRPTLGQTQGIEITARDGQAAGISARRTEGR
ncbi:MAG: hypothetical protein QOE53_37 [Pseudonocardiales bacterium]|nr:hypothetical protein [Pseudonocardiales bacterium]